MSSGYNHQDFAPMFLKPRCVSRDTPASQSVNMQIQTSDLLRLGNGIEGMYLGHCTLQSTCGGVAIIIALVEGENNYWSAG